ncbi:Oligopeptide transport ATP-binding protein OppF (TC 3.A.1.5.1) [hydrothermal vent metagenome]|uniref:Oligopeptide transport ATP-binding protein OppF (TC 3.A.1.5.1) n=1 Tax=hydrothermal vent metagenome TaxID=652676 RepID=A0A3B1CXD3_9ZZZZ
MQMVFQDPYSSLDPRFSVYRILKEAMTLAKDQYKTTETQLNRMEELLAAVNLSGDMLSRYPHEFSGGERQRIAIARALVLNPKVLILDEAVSSLDVLIQEQILNLLKELQEKFSLTYLFISHNLKVVRKISQKIAVMYQGKIVEMADTEEIFNNPQNSYTKQLLSAAIDYKVAS